MMGLQFENLVLVNFAALVPLLNLQGKLVVSAAPFRCVRSSRGGGVQVDDEGREFQIGTDAIDFYAKLPPNTGSGLSIGRAGNFFDEA